MNNKNMSSGIVETLETLDFHQTLDLPQSISLSSRSSAGIPLDITTQVAENDSSVSIGNGPSANITVGDLTLAPIQFWLRRDTQGGLFFVNRPGSEFEQNELVEKLAKQSGKKSGKKSGKNKSHGLQVSRLQ